MTRFHHQPIRGFGARSGSGCRGLLLAALAVVLLVSRAGAAEDSGEAALKLEYKLKAGFLFNFAKFVAWPTNAPGAAGLLRVGVLDDGPVYPIMVSELANKQVDGRTIEVVRCRQAEELKQCAMVFITRAESGRFKELKQAVAGTPLLTVGEFEDNLLLGAFNRHRRGDRDSSGTLGEVFAIFPRLKERRTQHAGTLSGGERQMLALARALMAKPRLLMLDEPSLGLAPLIVKEILRIVVQLKSMGVSILLVEQNARAALQVADYGYVLENGGVAVENEAKALLHDPRVIESYLGLGGSHSIAA